jgi:hypothetical protein
MRFALFLILTCLVAATASGQNPAQAFQKWSAENPTVRPWLFFNQPRYAPGDTVRFKAYMFENGYQQKGSFLLNVTVVNDDGKTVAGTSFRVKDGTSSNQIVLPDTLKGGVYRFFTHNQWMEGNPASPPVWKDIVVTQRKRVEPAQSVDSNPEFFPEGGTLINGIVNRVIVTMKGNFDSCRLQSNTGKVITTFKVREGAGSFHFTPLAETKYLIAIGQRQYPLPSAVNDGIGILLTRSAGKSSARVLLAAPQGSIYRRGPLYLLLSVNGVANYSQELSFGDLEVMQFGIPVNTLPAGVARLAVVSGNHQIIAERSFLVDYQNRPKVVLKARQDTVRSRGRMEIDVQVTDAAGAPLEGEFAVSAINQRLFPREAPLNFGDDLLTPPNNDVHIDRTKADWEEYADRLFIATKVDTAYWKEAFSPTPVQRPTGRYSRFVFIMTDMNTGERLPDHTRILVYLQRNADSYAGLITNGLLELVLPGDFWDVDDFYFLAETENGYRGDIAVSLQQESLRFSAAANSQLSDDTDIYADFISRVKMIDRSYGFFTRKSRVTTTTTNPNFSIEDELNGADIDIDLRKYISFPNMDEVLREIIPALSHRNAGNKSTVRVDLTNTDRIPKADPLYVIDGLMTLSSNYFMSLSPDNVATIKVVRDIDKLNRLGGVGGNGVVIVQTLKPNPDAVKATGAYVTVQGISSPVPFVATQHLNESQARIPDFRSTLYWNPTLRTGKDGKAVITCWASDDIGPIEINVVGTTSQGFPFSAQTIIEVVYDSLNK